jgi:hypothetical protein
MNHVEQLNYIDELIPKSVEQSGIEFDRKDLVATVRAWAEYTKRLEAEIESWCDNASEKEAQASATDKPASLSVEFSKLVRSAIEKRVDEWMASVGTRIEKAETDAKSAKEIADRLLSGFASHETRLRNLEPEGTPVSTGYPDLDAALAECSDDDDDPITEEEIDQVSRALEEDDE